MTKKVLITGALGQLGNSTLKQLSNKYELLATDIRHNDFHQIHYEILDISNKQQIENVLSTFKPNVIVNLAGLTNVDGCELYPDKANLLNAEAVAMLLEKFDGHFIHISTDYVFDGKNGPYGEDDILNPINTYGKTKLGGERAVQNYVGNWCILRTNVLFDYYNNTEASFFKWIIDSLKQNKPINVVNDQWNNPTWTNNFAKIIELVIEKDVQGVYHYGGADYLNRFEFAKLIAAVFELDESLINSIDTKSLNQAAKRPLRAGLKTDKIEQELSINCTKLIESLNNIKIRYKE